MEESIFVKITGLQPASLLKRFSYFSDFLKYYKRTEADLRLPKHLRWSSLYHKNIHIRSRRGPRYATDTFLSFYQNTS